MSRTENAIVMGIWGRAGGDGIPGLIEEMRSRLLVQGVKNNNIFSMSWNPEANDDPMGSPDTSRHLQEIQHRESAPSYIALIGHSYGGWAVSLVSKQLGTKADFVGLIDPVFGPTGDSEPRVTPRGHDVHNWYQRNSITEPTVIEDCTGVVLGCANGISCGRSISGTHNHKVKWRKDWNGKPLKRSCGFGRRSKRRAFHLNIDSDRHIWHQIIDAILADLKIFE